MKNRVIKAAMLIAPYLMSCIIFMMIIWALTTEVKEKNYVIIEDDPIEMDY